MNLADTELLCGHLGRHGYVRTDDPTAADVILINTCAIRDHAEERIIGRLGDLVRYKARRPDVRLGLAGCMAQHQRDRLMQRAPFLDFIVGPDAYRRLPEVLERSGGEAHIDVRLDRAETYADIVPQRDAGVRAWLTIMRGCDRFCSFCIVPLVRGRERSVPARSILEQVRQLADAGYREVIYLGQTVSAYDDGEVSFAELLRRTNAIAGIERIRFTSPHPCDLTHEVVEAMATCDKVCPQVHLPAQSGSDRVLAAMERGYGVDEYLAVVGRLRAAIPALALTTDIIVGFPGEDDDDFRATCELMRTVRYDGAFMFKYSARSGTKAAKQPETVSEDEKGRRLQSVIALQEEMAAAINRSLVGATVEVLVEGAARRPQGWLAGKTPQFKTTVFPADGGSPGALVRVRVTESTAHTLRGVPASPSTQSLTSVDSQAPR